MPPSSAPSRSPTAKSIRAAPPSRAPMPWATPPASLKWPAGGVPEKAAAAAVITTAAPATISTAPTTVSSRS